MKTLKKTLAGIMLAALALSALASGTTAFAQTEGEPEQLKAADILPSDIDTVYELNASAENPLEDFLLQQIEESAPENENSEAFTGLLQTVLEDNTITMATVNESATTDDGSYMGYEPQMYLIFAVSKEDYDKMLEYSDAQNIERFGDYEIWFSDETYLTRMDNLAVTTNSIEKLRELLNNYADSSVTKLSQHAPYATVRENDIEGSFLNIFINPSLLQTPNYYSAEPLSTALMMQNTLGADMLSALTAEGISVAQTDEGFAFTVSLEGDEAKLEEQDLTFDKYNFVPALYKNMSGKDLIYYQEENDMKARIEDAMKLLNFGIMEATGWENSDMTEQFKQETGIDLENEALPLLTGRNMITVHNTGQIIPGITFMAEVNNSSKAGNTLLKLVEYLRDTLEKDTFSYDIYNAGGTAFYEFRIDLGASFGTDFFPAPMPEEMNTLYLRMTATTDGLLVISTVPDLAGIFKNGSLTGNEDFSAAFVDRDEEIESIAYFSGDELLAYVNLFMDTFEAPQEVKDGTNGFLEPWNDIFAKSYADADSMRVEGFINVDTDALASYGEMMSSIFIGTEFGDTYTEPVEGHMFAPTPRYCDVSENDWFFEYVVDLSQREIIQGYGDGCFRPDQSVTRAEFVKMTIEAGLDAGLFSYDDEAFTNAAQGSQTPWYAYYGSVAVAKGIIESADESVFRPNDGITRAEAVQILFNAGNQLKAVQVVDQPLETLISFDDVSTSDWFFTAVVAAAHYNLVEGVSPQKFEPDRAITRAEAAKIVKLFLDLEQ